LFASSLDEAETVTKWIAAKRSGSMLRVLEDLLALGPERLDAPKSRVQVFYMEIEMYRSPMALELAPIVGTGRRLGPGRLLKQAEFHIEAVQDGYAGHRLSLLGETKRAAVKGNALRKVRYVDADRNCDGHWILCCLASW